MHAGVRAASEKKGIYIVIMKIIRINGAPRVVAWRVAWVCAGTVVPLGGMVCTDTPGSRSRMTCASMRVRLCACLCGIVGTCLCRHGLRCGLSSRRPGHGRPDSRSFSVSPCRRLRRILCCVHLYPLRLVGKYATDDMPSSGARASVTISHSARTI